MTETGKRILIADDEEAARRGLGQILTEDGYEVFLASDGEEALRLVAQESPDILLTDLRMPGMDGHELLNRVRQGYPDMTVVIMTAHGTIRSAVQALQEGAEDYLTKPIDVEELEHLLDRIRKKKALLAETRVLRERLDDKYRFENIIGRSPEILEVFRMVEQVAPTQASILIGGESGTGKELIANALHQNSPRRSERFLPVNCAAIPSEILESEMFGHEKGSFTGAVGRKIGKFELADRGTLFLDEVGEIPPDIQVKLLRVLEDRSYMRVGGSETLTADVRIIAATNASLEQRVAQERFRPDLYYRLKVVTLHIPPLRERREDIPLLVTHFLDQFKRENGREDLSLSPAVLRCLINARWEGNVRELRNLMESLVVMAVRPVLEVWDLPELYRQAGAAEPEPIAGVATAPGPAVTMDEIEREAILRTLKETSGNRTRAAEILGIGLRTLQRKLKEYGEPGE